MNKKLLITAILSIALMGCSQKDTTQTGGAVQLQPQQQEQTTNNQQAVNTQEQTTNQQEQQTSTEIKGDGEDMEKVYKEALKSTKEVADSLGAIASTKFQDFNNKILTGKQVISAIENYGSVKVILVNTVLYREEANENGNDIYQCYVDTNGNSQVDDKDVVYHFKSSRTNTLRPLQFKNFGVQLNKESAKIIKYDTAYKVQGDSIIKVDANKKIVVGTDDSYKKADSIFYINEKDTYKAQLLVGNGGIEGIVFYQLSPEEQK